MTIFSTLFTYRAILSVAGKLSRSTSASLRESGGTGRALDFFPRRKLLTTKSSLHSGIISSVSVRTLTATRNMSGASKKLKIVIFLGSTRQGRQVVKVGDHVKAAVNALGMEAVVLDPAELPFEVLKQPLHFMPDPTKAPQWLQDTDKTIKTADGFIFVSAEYNCGIPPALANMADHFSPASYRHRPVGLVLYSMGAFGGSRVSVILKPFVSELGLVCIPSSVTIPVVQDVYDASGKCKSERVSTNMDKLVKELEWYASGLKAHREAKPPPS